jgi:protein SCO1/2
VSRTKSGLSLSVAVVLVGLMTWSAASSADVSEIAGMRIEPPKAIHVRTLVNQDGQSVQFPASGRWQLAFFGFTSCPDICPLTVQKSAQVLKYLGPRASAVEMVFLSIDSDRDQPEQVKKFIAPHDPRIQGLTGKAGAVQTVANEFGVIARRYQGKKALDYRIEHSSFLYLLDPQGRIVTLYPAGVSPGRIAADLEQNLQGVRTGKN